MVWRTQEPDGTPYDFAGVILKIQLNGGAMSSGANSHYFSTLEHTAESKLASIWMTQVSGNYLARHEVVLDKGMWKVYYTNMGTNSGASALVTFSTSTIGLTEDKHPSIKCVSIDKMPIGTTVEIWGVRK